MAELKATIKIDADFLERLGVDLEFVTEAVKEKRQREETNQWLNDMNNPLEPIKIESALNSEVMKMQYRKANKPESISVLDYTIIAALTKVLADQEDKQ